MAKFALRILGFALLPILSFGCASDSTAPSTRPSGDIMSYDSLPIGVQAAFVAQHPYAEVDHPTTEPDTDGQTLYVIPYTQPEGDKAVAKYTDAGVAKQ
jgi:hypothetical protein